jgi:hypothetical protein
MTAFFSDNVSKFKRLMPEAVRLTPQLTPAHVPARDRRDWKILTAFVISTFSVPRQGFLVGLDVPSSRIS